MINIVCCTDHKYIMPTGVMIHSVCMNHPINHITFHIICNDDITLNDKKRISGIIYKYHNNVFFYSIDFNIPECFTVGKINQSKHITISAYYRLFLTQILPIHLNKILYLDVDIIVRQSLLDIYDIHIEEYGLGAVYDSCFQNIDCYERLDISKSYGYFNSGVLLINLDYWRNNKIMEKSVEIAAQKEGKLKYHDQDILNCIFHDKIINLPIAYNLASGYLYKDYSISNEYKIELKNAINNPYIIHYTGSSKPWHSACVHPFRHEFVKYFKQTDWYNPITFALSNIKKKIKDIIELLIVKKKRNPYI